MDRGYPVLGMVWQIQEALDAPLNRSGPPLAHLLKTQGLKPSKNRLHLSDGARGVEKGVIDIYDVGVSGEGPFHQGPICRVGPQQAVPSSGSWSNLYRANSNPVGSLAQKATALELLNIRALGCSDSIRCAVSSTWSSHQ